MSNLEKIFVFGAGGHAKVVIDIIERQRLHEIAFLVDDDLTLTETEVYGYRVIGGKSELLASGIKRGITAIGSNEARRSIAVWLKAKGFELVSAIHPSAQLARGVVIAGNSVVMAGAVVNSGSTIGYDVIINTRASIDHDCTIDDGVHIAPGVTLCGNVKVGAGGFVCAGATIISNLVIGSNVTIGAGATVIRDVLDNVIVVGSPARIIKHRLP